MRKSTIFGLTAGLALSAGIVFAAQSTNSSPATQADDDVINDGTISYVLTPAPGYVAEGDLSQITVVFNNPNVGFYENMSVATLELIGGETYYCSEPEYGSRTEDGYQTWILNFQELGEEENVTINQTGTYILTLRGWYTTTLEGEVESEPVDLPVMTAGYTIYPEEYTIYPAVNGYESTYNFTGVKVYFEEGQELGEGITLEGGNEEGTKTYTGQAYPANENDNTEWLIEFNNEGNLPAGTYTVTIPVAGQDEPIVSVFNLVDVDTTPSFNLEPGIVNELNGLIVTFADPNVGVMDGVMPAVAVLENTTTEDVYYCWEPTDLGRNSEGGRSFQFEFSELTSKDVVAELPIGNYTLTLKGFYVDVIDEDVVLGSFNLPVIEESYTLIPNGLVSLSPSTLSTVTDLSTITVTLNDKLAGFQDNNVIYLENTTADVTYQCTEPEQQRPDEDGYKSWVLTFTLAGENTPVEITEVGAYVLTLRGFYLTLGQDEEGNDINFDLPPLTYYYDLLPEGYISFDPESGATVENLSTVTVTIQDNVNVENQRGNAVMLQNATTGVEYLGSVDVDYTEDANGAYTTLTVTFVDEEGNDVVVNTVGNYILSLRNCYVVNEEDETDVMSVLPVFTAEYSVIPENYLSISPENGSTLAQIQELTLTFEGRVGFEQAYPGNVVIENTTTGNAWYCSEPLFVGYQYNEETDQVWSVYTVEFTDLNGTEVVTIDEVGNYVVSVKGFYINQNEDAEEEEPGYLPVFSAGYTILPSGYVTFSPEAGTTVENLNEITITFEGKVGYTEVVPANVTAENTTTGNSWYSSEPLFKGYDENGNSVYSITFKEIGGTEAVQITEAGNYEVTVRGFYINNNEDIEDEEIPGYLPVITVKYSIYEEGTFTLTPESGSEVKSINTIVLTFNENPMVGIYELRPAPVVLENLTTGDVWYCETPLKNRLGDASTEFTMNFSSLGAEEEEDIMTEGTYQLIVKGLYETKTINETTDKDGNVTSYEEVNEDLPNVYATYYVVNGTTGVQNLFNADSKFNVYSINGIQIVRNGNADSLNSLTPGLYIINGKKVLIRK
ncbi:MAG: hypothetical protein J1F12_05310 [Muribaculaceae bacterium]|nr:hypothetical protein [Muribaculaceae bacterium]